ncbi:hypothetical protein [Campylobacter hyointestinalis]|uniref:hypothetical protein n=1 Tax=Campylobacter hyointestinalis TaxID=198 RepID=UPI00112FAECB|nr:hypothetical protein [Campylobacter hyointestinalis]
MSTLSLFALPEAVMPAMSVLSAAVASLKLCRAASKAFLASFAACSFSPFVIFSCSFPVTPSS